MRVGRRIPSLRSDLETWVADHRAGHTANDVPVNADWRKRPQMTLAAERDGAAEAARRPPTAGKLGGPTTLKNVNRDDVVEVDIKGRRFRADVVDVDGSVLRIRPLSRNISYRHDPRAKSFVTGA